MRRAPIDERLANIPLFANLSKKQLAALGGLVTVVDVGTGRELVHQGGVGREFFLVVEGEAEVRLDGEAIAHRGPGTFFGETALLFDQPRNASVVALTDMQVEVIERRDFAELLLDFPDLYAPLLEAAAAQLAENEARD